MKKKFLALALAFVMAISLVGCAEEEQPEQQQPEQQQQDPVIVEVKQTATPTPGFQAKGPEQVAARDASIDFEDGNSAFALMSTAPNGADNSDLAVADYNGSKVLYADNKGQGKMYVGIGLEAILGDRIGDVRKIAFTIGVANDDKFTASEGSLILYAGEKCKKVNLGAWAVYSASKNPKEVSFNVPEGTFLAGAGNYMIIAKENTQKTPDTNDLIIDNIGFYDADGKVIAVDTTAAFVAPEEGFLAEEEADTTVKVAMDDAYAGDWGASATLPASELQKFDGPVTFTLKLEFMPGYDYYLWAPMSSWWNRTAESGYEGLKIGEAVEGQDFHLQADGFLVFDNWEASEITFTLTADEVARLISEDGFSGQTYGIVVSSATLSGDLVWKTEKFTLDEAYAGDWGGSAVLDPNVFSQYEGDVTVTLSYELMPGYDYYLWAPMTGSWTRLVESDYVGLTAASEAAEGESFHLQADGFLVFDNREATQLTFTMTADEVERIINEGGFSGQTYGVVVSKVTLQGRSSGSLSQKFALDEAYAGDWGGSGTIPAAELEKYAGDIEVTLFYELMPGYDYYLWAPMTAYWTRVEESGYSGLKIQAAAEEGQTFHLQADGFLVFDDFEATELKLTFTKEQLAKFVAEGGFSGQTYGVVVSKVQVNGKKANIVTVKADGDSAYTGDWTSSAIVLADELANFDGDITLTVKYELMPGFDYYIWQPMSGWWTKASEKDYIGLETKSEAVEGETFHLQADGTLAITDKESTTFSVKLTNDFAKTCSAQDGITGMCYGIIITGYEVSGVVNPIIETKVAGEDAYLGDWGGAAPAIEADVLSQYSGDVTVTVQYELMPGYDYYLWGPMDNSWTKLGETDYVNLPVKSAKEEGYDFHLQADGFLVIDNFEATELSFTLSADTVAKLAAGGGFGGQTYGVKVNRFVISGK